MVAVAADSSWHSAGKRRGSSPDPSLGWQVGQGEPHLHRDDNTGPPPRPTGPVSLLSGALQWPSSVFAAGGLSDPSLLPSVSWTQVLGGFLLPAVGGSCCRISRVSPASRWEEVTDTKLPSAKKGLDAEAKFA